MVNAEASITVGAEQDKKNLFSEAGLQTRCSDNKTFEDGTLVVKKKLRVIPKNHSVKHIEQNYAEC